MTATRAALLSLLSRRARAIRPRRLSLECLLLGEIIAIVVQIMRLTRARALVVIVTRAIGITMRCVTRLSICRRRRDCGHLSLPHKKTPLTPSAQA